MKTAIKILEVAEKNVDKANMRSSAEINIADCKFWIKDGNEGLAVYRGLKSLKYSLGIFSDKYKRVVEEAKENGFSEYTPA